MTFIDQISGCGYIACAHFEETIHHFGEGSSPKSALDDFIANGCFEEYCDSVGIEDNTYVEVKVFEAIYADDDEANSEDWEEGWSWILGEEVISEQILFLS